MKSFEKEKLKLYETEKSSFNDLQDTLVNLSQYMYKHYGKKVVILIDEYDVPLQSSYKYNYYNKMSNFISNVFSAGLKRNDALEKGVLTGCLRIAKESIFTGLNNFTVLSMTEEQGSQTLGFTCQEVDELLKYYDLEHYQDIVKEWYDGYRFGYTEIFNPWSVLCYVRKVLNSKMNHLAESFWANTSGNDIVYSYIKDSDMKMKQEFESLIQGKEIEKEIKLELTYREMDNIDNIYSFLLFTEYLKIKD